MFKKTMIWIAWLGGCFMTGFIGTKVFLKACDFVTKKLDE